MQYVSWDVSLDTDIMISVAQAAIREALQKLENTDKDIFSQEKHTL